MIMKIIFHIVTFLTIVNICKSTQEITGEKLSHFLNDFVKDQDVGTEVLFISCCKSDNLFRIMKDATFLIGFNRCNDHHIKDHTKKQNILFVVDLHCSSAKNYVENIMNTNYFRHPFRWIMISKDLATIPKITALPDSNIYLVTSNNFDTSLEINQFYSVEKGAPIIFELYGNWSISAGLIVFQRGKILSRTRRNLGKKVLTASVVITNNDTFNHLEDYRNKHIDSVTKTSFPITKHLIDCVNGTMNIIFTDTWGYKDPKSGKWTGMVGDLSSGKADLGGTSLFVTAIRIANVDYLSMTSPTKISFLFREPPLSYVSNIYSLPFTRLVWISAIAMVSLAVIIIFFTMKYQIRSISKETDEEKGLRFTDFILAGISAACQMGTLMQPKLLSARVSTIFLLIAVLFLYTSYTANIVALLQSTTKSIQTLSDLLKSQLVVAVDDTPYNHYYFPTATEPVQKELYKKKVVVKGVPQFINISDGIAKMRKGLFAFHVELGVGYKIIEESFYEHEKCNLRNIPFIQPTDPWYCIAKQSPYKEMLKVNLLKIREHGLQGREHARIYTKKPVCTTNGQSFGSVRLTDCYAAFVILSIGYGLAVVVILLERMLKNCTICLI